jgi:hypothetical protein
LYDKLHVKCFFTQKFFQAIFSTYSLFQQKEIAREPALKNADEINPRDPIVSKLKFANNFFGNKGHMQGISIVPP